MVLHLGLTDFDWFSNHRYLANATLFTYVCRISELKTAARVLLRSRADTEGHGNFQSRSTKILCLRARSAAIID